MARKKQDDQAGIDAKDLNDINRFLNKFLEETNRQLASSGALNQPLVFSFNIKIGAGGAPAIERFGNIEAKSERVTLSENREPLVDVIDRGDEITVIAEMPGVEEKDIRLSFEGKKLDIAAASVGRSYHKVMELRSDVDQSNYAYKYNNGVLEVTLKKKHV
ncbi:MAG: archaeal heat shock protein Hsp20 [Candidatus Micrarchaeaceae archaeon]